MSGATEMPSLSKFELRLTMRVLGLSPLMRQLEELVIKTMNEQPGLRQLKSQEPRGEMERQLQERVQAQNLNSGNQQAHGWLM